MLTDEEKIIKAKISTERKHPFYSIPLLKLQLIHEPKLEAIGALCGVSPDFKLYWTNKLSTLPEEQISAVLQHECLHILLMHLKRRGTREGRIMNIAEDMVINDILVQEHAYLPKEGIIPDHYHSYTLNDKIIVKDIDKKSAEMIYAEIYPKLPKSPSLIRMTKSEFQKLIEEGKLSKEEGQGFDVHITLDEGDEKVNEEIKNTLAQATAYAKQQGKLPAGIARLVDDILDSKINWRQKLYKHVISTIPHDYTWNKPNKRLLSQNIYMPALVKENIDLCVAVDTSGSIGSEELKQFLGEMISISHAFANIRMTVIVADSQIQNVYEVNDLNRKKILNLEMKGGGGTDHKCIGEYISKNISGCKCLIAFTDGYTSWWNEHKPFRTIVVLSKNSCTKDNIPKQFEVVKTE